MLKRSNLLTKFFGMELMYAQKERIYNCYNIFFDYRITLHHSFGYINFLLPLGFLFYLLRLVITLPLSQKARGKLNLKIRRVSYIFVCIALVIGLLLIRDGYGIPLYPYLFSYSTTANADNIKSIEHDEDGHFIINTKHDELKVLQLTDLHIGGSLSTYRSDFNAFHAMYDVIRKSKPDLIIITGDLVYPIPVQSLTVDNRTAFVYICDFMSKIGIPWAFVYGNHDTERISTYSAKELIEVFSAHTFDKGGKLLFSETQPSVYGRYNNLIEVRNADGSLNQALFLLDSNDYTSLTLNYYDSIHFDQIEWYRETVNALSKREGQTVSSMLFFHIPLQEFETAYQALLKGDSDAEYLFGSRREGCAC